MTIDNNQNLVKSWATKLLIFILWVISFFAGWQSYKSRQIDACLDNGGQVIERDGVMMCQ